MKSRIKSVLCSRWEVAICVSNQGFQQISFVNSIATLKGGKHVDHVSDMVVKTLTDSINKKDKTGMKISPKQIKDHMWIFIGCLVENPTFDSQSKENSTPELMYFFCLLWQGGHAKMVKNRQL